MNLKKMTLEELVKELNDASEEELYCQFQDGDQSFSHLEAKAYTEEVIQEFKERGLDYTKY